MAWWNFWKRKKKTKIVKMPVVKNVGIVIGHTKKDGGAWNFNKTFQEYNYWLEVCNEKLITSKNICIRTRDKGGVRGACQSILSYFVNKPEVIIHVHFNSYNGKVAGREGVYTTSLGKVLAEKYGKGSRGAKSAYDTGRGITNLEISAKYCDASFILEGFFGDNPNDYKAPDEMREELTEFINGL